VPLSTGPDEGPAVRGGAARGAQPQRERRVEATPATQAPAKSSGDKDLLELPLERLAEEPVRVTPPEAAAPGVAAAAAAPGAAAYPVTPGPVVTAASRREEKVSSAPAG